MQTQANLDNPPIIQNVVSFPLLIQIIVDRLRFCGKIVEQSMPIQLETTPTIETEMAKDMIVMYQQALAYQSHVVH